MLLVFGPRSTDYDFGPDHPLTPRRFGPSIDLLRSVGAEPGLAPEPAPDDVLAWCHDTGYLDVVRRFSYDPFGLPRAGIADGGDCPPFAGMHEASAAVAGGSLRAVEAILRGDVEHAQHPGGGLHHAMPARAAGFCIYNDPAIAIARARRDGLRVLYIDLDVHHGDGVQAIHWDDPGVLTFSIHETGLALFPGTGEIDEVGEGAAAGTAVNVPILPGAGDGAWLPALESLLPELAAAFGPDLIVSQHGADSHAWDPLAHLNVTTTAHGAAARMIDRLAHRYAGGRWLATGGGGYDAYRVVPRTWALTWLAGAHRDVPDRTPAAWRARWADEGARYGQAPLPDGFLDAPNAGVVHDAAQAAAEERSLAVAGLVRRVVVPRLLQVARDRAWWDPLGTGGAARAAGAAAAGGAAARAAGGIPAAGPASGGGIPAAAPAARGGIVAAAPAARGGIVAATPVPTGDPTGEPTIVARVDPDTWAGLALGARIISPADPAEAHALVLAGLRDGAIVTAAVSGSAVVGLVVSQGSAAGVVMSQAPAAGSAREILAIGVAPGHRRAGLAHAMLDAHVAAVPGEEVACESTLAERDVVEPLDRLVRGEIARRLLDASGFTVAAASPDIGRIDPGAIVGRRPVS